MLKNHNLTIYFLLTKISIAPCTYAQMGQFSGLEAGMSNRDMQSSISQCCLRLLLINNSDKQTQEQKNPLSNA